MSKEMSVIVLGLWLVVLPYLGIPGTWRTGILVLSGIGIAVIGFLLRTEALARGGKRSAHHPFVENTPSVGHHHSPSSHDQKEGITSLN